MARTAFVTGGTGFLGLNLISELARQGWRITALHRPASDLKYLRRFDVEMRVGSVGDYDSLVAAIPEKADAVFHVAANVSFWRRNKQQLFKDNVLGTRNMVNAALARKARKFVHTSSFVTFGHLGSTVTETTQSDSEHSAVGYEWTKYLSEREVQEGAARGLDAVILNPANIIGPYDTYGWSRIFRMVHEGSLPGISPGTTSFCHSEEVAKAHVTAVEKGRTGEKYLLGGVDTTYLEMVRVTGKLLGKKVPKRPIPGFLFKGIGRINDLASIVTQKEPDITYDLAVFLCDTYCCTSEKAVRELDYKPRQLEEMLVDCFAWMRKEGLFA